MQRTRRGGKKVAELEKLSLEEMQDKFLDFDVIVKKGGDNKEDVVGVCTDFETEGDKIMMVVEIQEKGKAEEYVFDVDKFEIVLAETSESSDEEENEESIPEDDETEDVDETEMSDTEEDSTEEEEELEVTVELIRSITDKGALKSRIKETGKRPSNLSVYRSVEKMQDFLIDVYGLSDDVDEDEEEKTSVKKKNSEKPSRRDHSKTNKNKDAETEKLKDKEEERPSTKNNKKRVSQSDKGVSKTKFIANQILEGETDIKKVMKKVINKYGGDEKSHHGTVSAVFMHAKNFEVIK